jgi:hypothetical protein
MLIQNKKFKKFKLKWFKSYKILKSHFLETYALTKSDKQMLRNLINKSRLIKANIENSEQLWSSLIYTSMLKCQDLTLKKLIKV